MADISDFSLGILNILILKIDIIAILLNIFKKPNKNLI